METPYLPPPTPLLSEVSAASHTRSLNPYLGRSFVPIQDIPYLIKGGITFCSGYSIKNLLNKPPLSSNKTRDDKLFKMPRSISYKQAGSMSGFLCHNIRRYFLLGGVFVWHVFEHLNMVLPWSTLESSLIKLRRGLLEGKSKKWVEVIASDMALHVFTLTMFVSFCKYVELNNIPVNDRVWHVFNFLFLHCLSHLVNEMKCT